MDRGKTGRCALAETYVRALRDDTLEAHVPRRESTNWKPSRVVELA